MKRFVLITLLLVGIIVPASAQNDDLYFVPKKKAKVEKKTSSASEFSEVISEESEEFSAPIAPAKSLEMDEDTYNRRGSYLTEQGDAVSEFAMSDEGFVLITEEGDTMWMNTDTLRLARVTKDDGWVGGFEGSDSDYEYAMRIVRFRNPRYAIPVSSPLYWDVVYGGALWPSWEWNIYDDGMYAYVFPTRSNWYYWDYMTSYPMGWGPYWGYPYGHHYGYHWDYHYGYHYGHVWYDPWYNPYFYGYHPNWHHGHHYHPHNPGVGAGKPGWGGHTPAYPNHRSTADASTRREGSTGRPSEGVSSTSRTGVTSGRVDGSATRRTSSSSGSTSSVRVVTDRTSSTVRSSSVGRTGSDEVVRRSTGSSSSVGRSGTSRSSSSSSYTRPSTSRTSSSSSSRSSSSSSSSVSRSSSSSGSSYSSGYSGSSRSSYSGGSSYSGSSRSSSSYSGGSSRSGSSGSRR